MNGGFCDHDSATEFIMTPRNASTQDALAQIHVDFAEFDMDPDDSQQAMEVLREAESMRPGEQCCFCHWISKLTRMQSEVATPFSVAVGVVNIEPIPEGEDAISTQIGTITVQPVLPVVEPNTKAADKTEEAVVENHSGDNQSRTLGTFKPIGTVIADTDNGKYEAAKLSFHSSTILNECVFMHNFFFCFIGRQASCLQHECSRRM